MRTIKFRCWDTKEKQMIDIGIQDNNVYSFWIGIDSEIKLIKNNYSVNNRYALMQFTGLLDKNGKEIYTGDILQGVGNLRFQVFYGKGGFSINTFQDELKDGYTGVNALADPQTGGYVESNCEVIGNIYTNPELLN